MKLRGLIALIASLLATAGAATLASHFGVGPAIGTGLLVLGIALYHDSR